MRFGSLFSGIGGLDLGLERAGMTCAWQVEIDDYCKRVLAKHWPDVPRHADVRTLTGDELSPVDLVAGGFPCQPVSFAGRRRAQDDERWLWPEFARILRVVRPRLALLENVPGLLTAGFGDVAADLAELGYDFEWDCIPAAAVGAPHLRYRVFVVAHAIGAREPADRRVRRGSTEPLRSRASDVPAGSQVALTEDAEPSGSNAAHTNGQGKPSQSVDAKPRSRVVVPDADSAGQPNVLGGAAFAERSRRGTIDRSGWWDIEPAVGRVAHGVPRRVDRLRGLGNAVVPQVAEFIGRRILEAAA